MTTDTAQRAATGPKGPGGRQVSWPRVSGAILAGLIALLFLAWLSFPAWAPLLAQRLVPDNWSLISLEVSRPGFSGLQVQALEARGAEAGMPLSVTAQNTSVRFDGPRIDIERLDLELTGATATGVSKPFKLTDFSLPRLAFQSDLPEIHIETLTLANPGSANGQQWTFTGLALGNDARGLKLNTVLPEAAPLNTDLELSLVMDGGQVDLRVTSADRPDRPLLSFVQQPLEADPSRAVAQLDWHWDLALLDATQLAQTTRLTPDMIPTSLLGELSGQINFRGEDRLRPENGELRVDQLSVQTPAAGLDSSLFLDWTREGNTVTAHLDALDINTRASGELILQALQAALEDLGIKGLITSDELSLSVFALDKTMAGTGAIKAEVNLDAPTESRISGSVGIKGAQNGAFEFAFSLPQFSATLGSGDSPALRNLNLDADGTFSLRHPVTVINGELMLGASSGSGAMTVRVRENGADQTLEATLTGIDFDGVSLSQPGMAASMASLSLSGALRRAANLSFSGQVGGTNLVLASEDQPLAPPLLSATSFDMALELDEQDATETSIRGPLVLSGVNLPVAAITADSVTLEMSPVTLPQLDGTLRLLTTGLIAEVGGLARAGMDLDLSGILRTGRFYEGDGEILLGYQATLPFGFSADLETTTGTVTFSQAVLPVKGLAALARPMGLTLPENLGFDAGQLLIDGDVLSGDAGISGALTITGQDLGLSLGESNLEGLNFTTRLDLADVVHGGGGVTLGIARLAAGLDLTSLSSDLAISSAEEFGARSLTAQLLGGLISIPSISLKAGELQDAQIEWEGFDLARLLKFVDINGLDGTGTMDARFPLVAEDDGPAVRNGSFAARGPGRLRYSSGVPAANIGLQALEDFEYQSLSGTLNYGSDGGYTIGVELLGANPELYNGYPIRFRLNLGGAMPALFRSLFITGDFEKGIIERLRSGEPVLEPETP